MSIDQSVELAAWLAIHSHEFVRVRGSVSEIGLREYWTLSRRRLDRWCRLLREAAAERGSFSGPDVWWRRTRPVLEEVFTTEILTRVWTALTSGVDRAPGRGRLLSVATNIQLGHSDARNRALHVLFDASRRVRRPGGGGEPAEGSCGAMDGFAAGEPGPGVRDSRSGL